MSHNQGSTHISWRLWNQDIVEKVSAGSTMRAQETKLKHTWAGHKPIPKCGLLADSNASNRKSVRRASTLHCDYIVEFASDTICFVTVWYLRDGARCRCRKYKLEVISNERINVRGRRTDDKQTRSPL